MNTFDSNRMDILDQTRQTGYTQRHAPGKAADSIVMPDSTPEALTEVNGVRLGSLFIYKEPPYQKLVVQDENRRSFRGEAALPVIFAELRAIAAMAKDSAAAIAASVEAA